jgi:hypothetical protein
LDAFPYRDPWRFYCLQIANTHQPKFTTKGQCGAKNGASNPTIYPLLKFHMFVKPNFGALKAAPFVSG